MNANSSRFTAFTKVSFSEDASRVLGVEAKTLMLETSRLCNPLGRQKGRTFHIFYQVQQYSTSDRGVDSCREWTVSHGFVEISLDDTAYLKANLAAYEAAVLSQAVIPSEMIDKPGGNEESL